MAAPANLPLCQSGCSSHSAAATQPLSQRGWTSHSATQSLRVAEWVSGCVSRSARVAEWLSGWSSLSGRVAEWLSGCFDSRAVLHIHSLYREFQPCHVGLNKNAGRFLSDIVGQFFPKMGRQLIPQWQL